MTGDAKKKTKQPRPAERTLQWLKRHGAMCEKLEHWNPYGGPRIIGEDGIERPRGVRVDAWGLVDVEAMWPGRTDYVQACGTDFAKHATKIKSSIDLLARLDRILKNYPYRRFFIIGWRKRQLKHQKKPEWVKRVQEIRPPGFTATLDVDPDQYLSDAMNGAHIIYPEASSAGGLPVDYSGQRELLNNEMSKETANDGNDGKTNGTSPPF